MTQAQQARPIDRSMQFAAAVAGFVAATAVIVILAVATLLPAEAGPRAGAAAPDVTYGGMPHITASEAARRQAALAAGATDGWGPRYLTGASAADAVTDGWSSRYLTGAAAADAVTDGWASRYLEPR